MSNDLYDIVFQGQIQDGFDAQQVKEQIGRLFNANPDTLARMFSGQAIVIKKGADRATAEKYQQAMTKAGAIVQINAAGGQAASSTPAAAKAPAAAPVASGAPAPASGEQGKRKSVLSSLSVAPLGESLIPAQEFVPAKFNTEGMTMAPVGSTVSDPQAPPPPFQAKLGELSIAQAGERILDPNAAPAETRGAVMRYDWDE